MIGPFVYDSSKPDFTGEISLSVEHTKSDTFLVARWEKDAFTDHGDPNALSYEIAIGRCYCIISMLCYFLCVFFHFKLFIMIMFHM